MRARRMARGGHSGRRRMATAVTPWPQTTANCAPSPLPSEMQPPQSSRPRPPLQPNSQAAQGATPPRRVYQAEKSAPTMSANDAVVKRRGRELRSQVDDPRRSRAQLATPGTALPPRSRRMRIQQKDHGARRLPPRTAKPHRALEPQTA